MNITLRAVGLLIHWYIMGRGYLAWSTVYRMAWDRKYRDVPLPKFTLEQARKKMEDFQWRADGVRTLGDAVATPQSVQARGFDPETRDDNDCDEEGIYLANTIDDPRVQAAELMTVSWYNPDDPKTGLNTGFMGHNVCLLTQLGLFRYMDYHAPQALHTSELEVARDVVRDYTRGKGVLLCWHVSDKNVRPLRGQVL